MDGIVNIKSRDYWFKIVGFLQQNWALIDLDESGAVVYFLGDTSGVFDKMKFPSLEFAEKSLQRNGFSKYDANQEAQRFISRPLPPFESSKHPNGRIYSSGQFWI